MPRDLFAQTHTQIPRRSKSRWTVAGSFVGHLVLLALLVVVPMVSTVDGPDISSRLQAFVVEMPPPPTPLSPARPAVVKPVQPDQTVSTIPVTPPEGIAPERITPGVLPGVPSASAFSDSGRSALLLLNAMPALEAPPVQRPREPVRPGGAIQEPRRITYVPPVYPDIARQARISGTVILEAVIDEAGVVRDVKVLRSIAMLERPAIEAVSKWRYTPTRLNGMAVPILMTVTVTFSLQ